MPVPFRNRPVRAAFLVVAFATAGSAQSPLFTTDVYDVPPDHRLRRVFDADGDGDLDVLAHRFEGFVFGTVRILWNEGDGRFGARTPTITSAATDFLSAGGAFGDFDGDGDDDAFGRVAASAVGFLRNDGGGAFSTPPASAPLPLPIAVSNAMAFAADFDADGKIDVAFSSVVGGAVLASGLWLRTGAFTFVAGAPLPLPPGYAVVAAYAANGDGLPDLLAAAPLGPATPAGIPFAFLPLVNLGGGVFAPGVVFQGPPEFASAPTRTVDDFDGDGVGDVLYETQPAAPGATRHDLVLLRGDGAGGFAAPLITPQAGGLLNNGATLRGVDVDGDAIPELLRAGFDGPALGGNSEGYAAHLFAYAPGVGHPGPALAVLPRVASVLVFDADGDGDRDVLAGTTTPFSANATYYANGSGALVSHDAAPAMTFAGFPVQWGDLDGDGDTDVFRRNPFFPSTSLFVATNDGGARFTTVADQTSSFYFGQPFVVDWNFDGRDDLLLLQTGAADAWAPSVDGPLGPNFDPPIPIPFDLPQANWTDRVDLDSDGDLDLVLRFAVNQAPVALFDLGGTWSSPTPLGAAPAAGDVSVAYGDFDGDADLDFVKRPATGPMTLGLRQPNGTYAESALPAAVSGSVVAAGDFDGDGDADLLAGKTPWFSTPGGFVAGPVAPFVPTTAFFTASFGAADLDDDGDLDAYADGGFCRWNGAGFGPFEEIPQSPHVGDVNFGLVTRAPWKPIDLDRDGDLDALDFNGGAFLNATRQIYAGRRARPGGTASVLLRGTPNQIVFLYGSALRLDPPAALPPWGHVFIDVFTAVGVFGAVCDADGRAEALGFLANDPALLGLELHWQAALPDQAAITGVATTRVLSL